MAFLFNEVGPFFGGWPFNKSRTIEGPDEGPLILGTPLLHQSFPCRPARLEQAAGHLPTDPNTSQLKLHLQSQQ